MSQRTYSLDVTQISTDVFSVTFLHEGQAIKTAEIRASSIEALEDFMSQALDLGEMFYKPMEDAVVIEEE